MIVRCLPWYCPICGDIRPNGIAFSHEVVCLDCAAWANNFYLDFVLGTV